MGRHDLNVRSAGNKSMYILLGEKIYLLRTHKPNFYNFLWLRIITKNHLFVYYINFHK